MKKLILILFLIPRILFAEGIGVGLNGARLEQLTRESTIFELSADVMDPNTDNLLNISGFNKLLHTESLDNAAWGKVNVTVSADSVPGPGGSLAELLTPTAADSYIQQGTAAINPRQEHICQFDIRTPSGTATFDISIYNNGHVTRRAYRTITATQYWATYEVRGGVLAGDGELECTIGGNNSWSVGENIYATRARVAKVIVKHVGKYHKVDGVSQAGLDHVGPGAAVDVEKSILQDTDGNRYQTINFVQPLDYFLLFQDALNIFDEDHTITLVMKNDISKFAPSIFSFGFRGTDGINIIQDGIGSIQACYSGAAGEICVDDFGTEVFESIYQITRESGIVTIYTNGNAGVGVDVTGYGDDTTADLYLGQDGNFIDYWEGSLTYLRVDTEALSLEELRRDRMKIHGMDIGYPVYPTIVSRDSIAACEYHINGFEYVGVDEPRVYGEGGGLLIEGERTNYIIRSDAFGLWDSTAGISVTSNYDTFITGLVTADRVIAESTVDYVYEDIPAGAVAGDSFAFSIYAKCCDISHELAFGWLNGLPEDRYSSGVWANGLPDEYNTDYTPWTYPCSMYMRIDETGTANTSSATYTTLSATEYQRFDVTLNAVGGGTGDIRVIVQPGNAATYVNGLCLGGAVLEEGTFASTLIQTSGAVATRYADIIYTDINTTNTNRRVLPDSICPTCTSTEVTISFEAKCVFNSSADIGTSRTLMSISPPAGASNLFYVFIDNAGRTGFNFYDSASALHRGRTAADPVDFDVWNKYKAYIDVSDLSTMYFELNDSAAGVAYVGNAGTATLDTIGSSIKYGRLYNAVGDGSYCKIRNLRIQPSAF